MTAGKKLYLVNGFLGSGKTTAITAAADLLMQQGINVGVVTNDQGHQLVDTSYLVSKNIPADQVVNGCFCCNYHDLVAAITRLQQTCSANTVFAESVGSCTDLVATIIKPMNAAGGGRDIVITVVADAVMLTSMLNASMLFDKTIVYIFQKQLEEADIILVTRKDLFSSEKLARLLQQVQDRYPGKFCMAAGPDPMNDRSGYSGIHEWLELLYMFPSAERNSLQVDYDLYAAGEAALAWFDLEIIVRSAANNADTLSYRLANKIFTELRHRKLQIGHLKCYLHHQSTPVKISFTNSTDTLCNVPASGDPCPSQKLLINARVETSPSMLSSIIWQALEEFQIENSCSIDFGPARSFKPGYPEPVHRIS
ncbi:MAG: hypothetical protein EOP49_26440 [Sphingobacteriales bacterium]|nr:MAG: hypothetical protein EOP49_26440 [Sphingobacteriales bacterium]